MYVKICGLRRFDEIETAVDAGADAIGIVLAESPRRVSLDEAVALRAAIPPEVDAVAVFRRPSPEVLGAVLAAGFDTIQADATWTPPDLGSARWLPALSDGPDLAVRAAGLTTETILVDGPFGGGRGVPADADRVAALAAQRSVVLAGGLTPNTVGAAITRIRPHGVDVSSGVERSPGVKEPVKIRDFLAAVRAVEGQ